MSTDTSKPRTQEAADARAMLDHVFKGTPVDPAVRQRVHERAETIRRRLPLTDIAVDLIRESREDL